MRLSLRAAAQADLLPRLCGLCLGTTSASVRTAALLSMGKLLPSVELDEAKKMMTVCGKVGTPRRPLAGPRLRGCAHRLERVKTQQALLWGAR